MPPKIFKRVFLGFGWSTNKCDPYDFFFSLQWSVSYLRPTQQPLYTLSNSFVSAKTLQTSSYSVPREYLWLGELTEVSWQSMLPDQCMRCQKRHVCSTHCLWLVATVLYWSGDSQWDKWLRIPPTEMACLKELHFQGQPHLYCKRSLQLHLCQDSAMYVYCLLLFVKVLQRFWTVGSLHYILSVVSSCSSGVSMVTSPTFALHPAFLDHL